MSRLHKRFVLPIGYILVLGGCSDHPSLSPAAARSATAPATEAAPAYEGRYIVVLKKEAGDPRLAAERLTKAQGGELRHVYGHALRGFSAKLSPQAAEALRHNPIVEFVEPNKRFTVVGSGSQASPPWNLDRIDQRDLPLNGAYQYAFSGAAPLYGERGLRIYVLDTGIMTSHQEFVDPDGYVRAKVGYDARPQDGQNGQDCHGHGTHVAATAGGKTVGVAKSAELIAVRITTACLRGGSIDDGVKGIDWVAGIHGFTVGVLNLSWAVEDQWGNETTSYAVDNALYNAQWYGNLVGVAAAGNDNKDACYVSPAAVARIAVGATNSSDSRAAFSNRGSCVDIFAPGEGILSAALDGGYWNDSGTSMAAPHVSGVIAQMVEQDPFTTGSAAAQAVLNRSTTGKVQNAGSGSPNRLLFSN